MKSEREEERGGREKWREWEDIRSISRAVLCSSVRCVRRSSVT